MATRESENFYRLVALLVDIGGEALRRLFLKYAVTPPTVTSITQFLVQEQNILARLASKRILGPAQMALIQPPLGQVVDPQLWDISLLCVLLKNLCPISPIEKKEIDAVRTARNELYGHSAGTAISDTDFLNQWTAVEASIKFIVKCCNDADFENQMAKNIDNAKTGPLDIDSIVHVFKLTSRHDEMVQSKLDAIKETVEDVSAILKDMTTRPQVVDHVYQNLKEQTRSLFEYKCKQPFIPTKQFGEALSMFKQTGSVIISGKPGEGKTFTAYKLIESLGLTDKCLRLYHPSQWDHVGTDEIDVILLDDIFGKHQLDSGSIDNWLPVLTNLEASIKSGELKLVLTCRQNVLIEAESRLKEIPLIQNNVIKLTSSKLTEGEKHGILGVLLDYHKRDKSKINIPKCCFAYKANIGFPYCSFLFSVDKHLFELQEKFFAKPVQFFKESLGAMSKNVKAALLFLFYMQGECSEKDLKSSIKKAQSKNEEILAWISDLIGIQDEMSLAQVRDCLDELSGVYITHLNKSFTFAHNIVYESIALMHAEKYPEEVIEHCTWNFIKGYVVTVGTQDVAQLVLDKDLYESLCLRFITVTMTGKPEYHNFYDIRSHPTMQTREICVTLYELLQKQGKIRDFFTCLMHDNKQGGFLYGYLHSKDKDEIPFLVVEAIPYLKCTCHKQKIDICWKCNVRNDTARAACFTGDIISFMLMLEEGITVSTSTIRDACTGMNPELLKLVISTLKDEGKFLHEDVGVSKSLVVARKSSVSEMYEVLRNEGAVVMPLCVYDAVVLKSLEIVDHFVKELKVNGRWDTADFWLQKALEESISHESPDIHNLLVEEGLKYHRGCILSAVKSKDLSTVQRVVMEMKALGSWKTADWSLEQEMRKLTNMLHRGETMAVPTIPLLADIGVSEALIIAKNYEDKTIYKYLQDEGAQITMEALPPAVQTRQEDLVKDVIQELKDQNRWDPNTQSCAKAMLTALRQDLNDILDVLVTEGLTCTMELLSLIITEKNITVKDIETLVTQISDFGNWQPDSIPMQSALIQAYQREEKSIFNFLIANGATINPVSVLTAVFSQDISTASMCIQILKESPNWDPSDQILNMCMQMTKSTAPEMYALLLSAGVGYSSKSLLAAAGRNDSVAIMMTINELIGADIWKPDTDPNITRSLELVCHHNNMMMFNILQKKGAKLNEAGVFNIIQGSKSLWYNTGSENRKEVIGIPTLTALVTASIARKFLVQAFQQKVITVYVRLIHALEETGSLNPDDPLLRDALVAAVESGDMLAYDIAMETGTEMAEDIVLKLLLSIKGDFRIELPERLINLTYKICAFKCLLESIRKGNIRVVEEIALIMKGKQMLCQDDERVIQAIAGMKTSKQAETIQKVVAFEFLSESVALHLKTKPQKMSDADNEVPANK